MKCKLLDASGSSAKEIYQHKLRQISRVGKIGLAVCHSRHLLYKVDKIIIAGQHECVDHYTGFPACLYFFESFGHHEGIATHRVFVQPASRIRASLYETRRRLAVRDHDDLLHFFALGLKEST